MCQMYDYGSNNLGPKFKFKEFIEKYFPCYKDDWDELPYTARISFSKASKNLEKDEKIFISSMLSGTTNFVTCGKIEENYWQGGIYDGCRSSAAPKIFEVPRDEEIEKEFLRRKSDILMLLKHFFENVEKYPVQFSLLAIFQLYKTPLFDFVNSDFVYTPTKKLKKLELEKGENAADYIFVLKEYFEKNPTMLISPAIKRRGNTIVVNFGVLKKDVVFTKKDLGFVIPLIEDFDKNYFEILNNLIISTAVRLSKKDEKNSENDWKLSLEM